MAVERIEIHEHVPYGAEFDSLQPYALLRATAYFAVDPFIAANDQISDLSFAAQPDGMVRFSADLQVVYPSSASSMPLLYVVANRGRASALPLDLSGVEATSDSPSKPRAGDGFLLRNGFAVVWTGWQWDIENRLGLLGLRPPLANLGNTDQSLNLELRIEVDVATYTHVLIDTRTAPTDLRGYRARARDDSDAELWVQDVPFGPFQSIDHSKWRFTTRDSKAATDDLTFVTLVDGFVPGRIYRLRYRPADCPVNGSGLIATRDVVSMLRYDSDVLGTRFGEVSTALGFGVSQSGRFLRQFLFDGMNVDEDNRAVFDGLLIDVAGPRRGEFNVRYGQLSTNRSDGVGVDPPFATDHATGGLLDRQRDLGHVPKTMLVNTASEYWRRNASFLTMETDATADFELAPDVRAYVVAGTSHVLGAPVASTASRMLANPPSNLSRWPVERALLIALEQWTRYGIEPPATSVPTLLSNSAITRESALKQLAMIPGLALPAPELLDPADSAQADPESAVAKSLRPLVSQLDEDGNERCGVILPELSVPIATHLGINTLAVAPGESASIVDLIGTSYPFPGSSVEREQRGDPRRALAERYADEDD